MDKILQKEDIKIYCEHCNKTVKDVWMCKMDSIIGIRYALLCTCCQKLIGIYSSINYNGTPKIPKTIFNDLQTTLN